MTNGDPLLRAALDAIPQALVIWGPDGKLALANRRLLSLLGLTAAEVAGIARPELDEKVARHPAAGDEGRRLDRRSSPIPEGGTVELFDLAAEPGPAARRDQLMGIALHDLRSPLANVRSYASLLLGGRIPSLDARVRRSAEVIIRNADRALKLLQSYFDSLRAELTDLDVDRQPVALIGLLQEVAASRRATAAEKDVEITLQVPPTLPPLLIDRERMSGALGAFLDNAVARTGPKGQVVVHCEERPAEVWIGFVDGGPALPPAAAREVFDRDAQILRERRLGVGFGLSVARAVAIAHGGTAGLTSDAERTLYFLTIPR